jgi:glycosyltransferase involved in cell wall biosynthesis
MSRKYVLITPCRNEAAYITTTIDSIAGQTVTPAKWIIVDDGSTDGTAEILADAAAAHPFIEIVQRADRGGRSVGPGVIEAFYEGLDRVDLDDFDYVGKLDGDLELPATYFERVMERFEGDDCLGNFSGKPYLREGDTLVYERFGDENAVGAAKFYRVECFRAIGGFVRQVSWDGIDGHQCRRHGWIAESSNDERYRFIHLRRMGSSQKSLWSGRLRWGAGKHYMGSAFSYVLAVAAYRMLERPYVVSGLGILLGYLRAAILRQPRYEDGAFRHHLRQYEAASLFMGKRRALRRANERVRAARRISDDLPRALADLASQAEGARPAEPLAAAH